MCYSYGSPNQPTKGKLMTTPLLNFRVYGMWGGTWAWVDSFASEGRAVTEGKELVACHGATAFKVVTQQ